MKKWLIDKIMLMLEKTTFMTKQITTVLSRSAWDTVTIHENNERLIEVYENKRLKLGKGIKSYQPLFFLRESVAERLYNVPNFLSNEFNLVLIEGFRTLESQQQEWDAEFRKIKEDNQGLGVDEIEKRVRLIIAKPSPLANHHCGGALDVALEYKDGTRVDMGTTYISQSRDPRDKQKFPMLSPHITDEQIVLRGILCEAMERAGFVWYPGEWWHYCYGDRMWAVYTHRTSCFYGSVSEL